MIRETHLAKTHPLSARWSAVASVVVLSRLSSDTYCEGEAACLCTQEEVARILKHAPKRIAPAQLLYVASGLMSYVQQTGLLDSAHQTALHSKTCMQQKIARASYLKSMRICQGKTCILHVNVGSDPGHL